MEKGATNSKTTLVYFSRLRHPSIRKKSLHKNIRSRTACIALKKSSTSNYDSCGLRGNYDTFSDDECTRKCREKKRQPNSKFVISHIPNNKSTTKEIQQKFELIDKVSEKVQSKMKSLLKSILKKDKIISEIEKINASLKSQLQEFAENSTVQNGDLIELANTNNRLQKEIEKKNMEMSTLQTKINKSEFIRTNLLKDIDFYKNELNTSKNGNVLRPQNYSEEEYEKIQRKFFEIKVENSKLCRKFKEIRSPDEENCAKSHSYHLLCKKFEAVQHDMTKFKMENKKLKEKIRRTQQNVCDDETSEMIKNTTKAMNEEIKKLTEIKKRLETENQDLKAALHEVRLDANKTKAQVVDLQSTLEGKVKYCRQCEEEINRLNNLSNDLEKQLKTHLTEKERLLKQHWINEENCNHLKLKLDELTCEKSELSTQTNIETEEEIICENCLLLKNEIEKMGYANLRLNKEKQNIQANFQKLSVKTSKLTLKMEELEQEVQKKPKPSENREHDDSLLQQNVLLSKRLLDLLRKSEKLFKAHVQQHAISEKEDIVNCTTSYGNKIIEELNENLSFSKSNLEMIENKLNEEEWKLNAALKHIRQVKEQIKMEI